MQLFTPVLGTFFFAFFTAFLGSSTTFRLSFNHLFFGEGFRLFARFFCRLALFFRFFGFFLGFFQGFLFRAAFCFLFFDLALGLVFTLLLL